MDNSKSYIAKMAIKFNMTHEEIKVLKLTELYHKITRKTFPEFYHPKKARKSEPDPRKSIIFKYCYKLYRETKNKLKDSEYKLYIKAQMDVLKNIVSCKGEIPNINPNILVGDKAWMRWLVWKKQYTLLKDKKATHASEELEKTNTEQKIIKDLKKTKQVLKEKLLRLSKKEILNSLNCKAMVRWVVADVVSPYYLCLSPVVRSWMKKNNYDFIDTFMIDITLYEAHINSNIVNFFKKEFAYEF